MRIYTDIMFYFRKLFTTLTTKIFNYLIILVMYKNMHALVQYFVINVFLILFLNFFSKTILVDMFHNNNK